MMSGMDVSAMEPMLVKESELALEDITATLLADSNGRLEHANQSSPIRTNFDAHYQIRDNSLPSARDSLDLKRLSYAICIV